MRRAAAHLISWHAEPGEGEPRNCDESAAAAKPCSLPATVGLCDRHLHKVVAGLADFLCKTFTASGNLLCVAADGRREGGRRRTAVHFLLLHLQYLTIQLA